MLAAIRHRPRALVLALLMLLPAPAASAPTRAAAPDLEAGFLDRVRAGACDETTGLLPGWDADAVASGAPSLGRPDLAEVCGASDVDVRELVVAEAPAEDGCGEPQDTPEAFFEEAGRLPTPRGQAVHAPVRGLGDGAHARLHWDGDVSVIDRDGDVLWSTDVVALHDAWDLPYLALPYLLYGLDPSDPFDVLSDRPFDVGDLTGDGVDDVAAAHWSLVACPPQLAYLPRVTVLDGTDGRVLWSESLPGTATQVRVLDGRLLVGRQGGGGQSAAVLALDLVEQDGVWSAAEAWRVDTGSEAGAILDLEPAAGGVLVASTVSPLGSGAPVRGTVVLTDPATGEPIWSVATAGYPRTVDADAQGVLVHMHTDPGQAYDATLLHLDAATGTETARRTYEGTILLDVELADVAPAPGAEILSAGVLLAPTEATDDDIGEGQVVAHTRSLDPLWTHARGAPAVAFPYRIVAGEGAVVVGTYEHPAVENVYVSRLHGLDGATGTVRWTRDEHVPFPSYFGAGERDGETVAIGSTWTQRLTIVDPATGDTAIDRGLPGNVYGLETFDVNEDGTQDLLLGIESGAVVAADGRDLDGLPSPLWEVDATHAVHELRLADLDGEGGPELVIVAEETVHVADPATGEIRFTLPFPGELIWTVTIADLDGDGRDDLLVPSTSLTAWRGADGSSLWTYAPIPVGDMHFSTPAVAPDGTVAVQIVYQHPTRPVNHGIGKVTHGHHALIQGLDGATGELLWAGDEVEPGLKTRQWRTVRYGDVDGTGREAFLMTYQGWSGTTPRFQARMVAIDASTGEMLAEHTSAQHSIPTGVGSLDGRLLAMSWWGAMRFDGPDATELEMGQLRQLGTADLGTWGHLQLGTDTQMIRAYRDDLATWTPPGSGDHPRVALRYGGGRDIWNGAFDVADLDGDGVDEVIAHLFDYSTYLRLDYFEAAVSSHTDVHPYGVAVLEAPQG